MKNKLLIGLIILLVCAGASRASSTATVTLTVTVTPTLSVSVPRVSYDFGTLNANTSSIAAESTAVINDSPDAIQKYSIRASDAKGAVEWNLVAGGSESTDSYSLRAMFNSSRPAESDFTTLGADGDLTNVDQPCDGTKFAGDQDGYNIIPGTVEYLWFRIKTPVSVGSSDKKTIFVTITAVLQGG